MHAQIGQLEQRERDLPEQHQGANPGELVVQDNRGRDILPLRAGHFGPAAPILLPPLASLALIGLRPRIAGIAGTLRLRQ